MNEPIIDQWEPTAATLESIRQLRDGEFTEYATFDEMIADIHADEGGSKISRIPFRHVNSKKPYRRLDNWRIGGWCCGEVRRKGEYRRHAKPLKTSGRYERPY